MSTILPLAYLPSVEYFTHLLRGGCVVDLGEHFVKRSERNPCAGTGLGRRDGADRCMSATPTVPGSPCATCVSTIPNAGSTSIGARWWPPTARRPISISTPDGSSLSTGREWEFLADYNLGLLEVLCSLAGVPMPELSRTYVERPPETSTCAPNAKKACAVAEPYFQVFSERMPFVPNLSFADLLFAEGPASVSVLGRCRQG